MSTKTSHKQSRPGLILMYHAIDPDDGRYNQLRPGDMAYTISLKQFHEHLRLIDESDYSITTPLLKAQPNPGEIWLTFDDGWSSDYDIVFPILQKRAHKAAFFITTQHVGTQAHLDWNAIKAMNDAGMLIGSHGHTHTLMGAMNALQQQNEMTESRKILQAKTDQTITAISLPGGSFNKHTLDMAKKAGYQTLFTSQPINTTHTENLNVQGRIAIRKKDRSRCIQKLLSEPDNTVKKLQRSERRKSIIRKILGARCYHWLHNALR